MAETDDDEVIEDDVIFGMISNAISVGGFKLARSYDVTMDDGFFEVVFVKKALIDFFNASVMLNALLHPNQIMYTHCEPKRSMFAVRMAFPGH